MIGVDGTIQKRSYEAQDGSKRYVTEVLAENVEFVGAKQDGHGNGAGNSAPPPPPAPPQQPKQSQEKMDFYQQNGFTEVEDDDDLPF